jgi:hypothetical protein
MEATVEIYSAKTSLTKKVMVIGVFDNPEEAIKYDTHIMTQIERACFGKKAPPKTKKIRLLWLETKETLGMPNRDVIQDILNKIDNHDSNIFPRPI